MVKTEVGRAAILFSDCDFQGQDHQAARSQETWPMPKVDGEEVNMTDDRKGNGQQTDESLIAKLVREAGITEQQASELVRLIGTDWESLLREARFLKKRH
ncbi:hypothetical protein EN828_05525 [Mesorhizobium sp. M2D.F.Ca.ET.185.01.1.1]|uniref:hypothetical protein n=1 Tax=unclassified Mesorhizobium TaxID=325217 RepID=UPI000FCAC290|nr:MULTISPECIES: hypothetical protein [unclassified Mesorhizobium]TGP77432.1 hypothetical protein EN870_19560 [bacterium M00.F.Ca.ET.227.01.1.1]TGP93227.1 hypothetical protein EN865_19755 [bacterium M00.F.Ca.ET.222.01.1.1]TGP96773.1 hypothetical protein EN864_10040 [bacterium M00.F.Ca.ET.221.01.1.1]TGT94977.1 hypothetical protein EN806_54355 [bacterium M00.F.Ca.ET.163.01.1.1]TGU21190.1 hypothetical protein EN799_54715 [bacterium M00.F.Ca.ET.156.01.1.1]TGU49985.1 hypothetical protein EN789_054